MHKGYRPNEAPRDYNYEEFCTHCDSDIEIVIDNADYTHYEITCPVCGNKMMLCTLCRWDQEDEGKSPICDWCDNKCFRKAENT